MNKKQRKMLTRILIAAALTVALQFIPVEGWVRLACFCVVYLIIGYDILSKALRGMTNGRVFDENFLMVVATLGAFGLAIYEGTGDYNEAIAVMLFYQVGEFFQGIAVGKSRRDITAMMDIRPDYANVESDGGEVERVDPDDVEVGTMIVVRPGERVPIDGIVREGRSSLNTSALTGESLPRDVAPGDDIVSGCINMTGVLRIETTREFGESTVSKILELMEDSASHKSQSEAFISRFARVYTPVVCYAALALALLPPLVLALVHLDASLLTFQAFSVWLYRALTFLVISCPCALVVSIPLSFFAGIGGASRAGVLVKGSIHLETLAKVRTVVFDKTGTLTEGTFQVNATHHPDFDEQTGECHCHECRHIRLSSQDFSSLGKTSQHVLEYAALAECASLHPIALSLRRAYGRDIDHSRVSDIHEVSGQGITALIDGRPVAVGNEKLMHSQGVSFVHCLSVGTIVHVAIDHQYAGHIVISDVIKADAAEAIASLHRSGVSRIVMLTGDAKAVADDVARRVGVDECYSELLPDGKVAQLEQLLDAHESEQGKHALAFVGDGINDAPVLRRADIGIAMGALGSDAAIEAADIVLMDDDPAKITTAVRIARHTMSIVWQNIIFALGVKVVCLILGAFGFANMWLAVFADVGVMILAILNAMRAMYVKTKP